VQQQCIQALSFICVGMHCLCTSAAGVVFSCYGLHPFACIGCGHSISSAAFDCVMQLFVICSEQPGAATAHLLHPCNRARVNKRLTCQKKHAAHFYNALLAACVLCSSCHRVWHPCSGVQHFEVGRYVGLLVIQWGWPACHAHFMKENSLRTKLARWNAAC
jgi:hypothetical protein